MLGNVWPGGNDDILCSLQQEIEMKPVVHYIEVTEPKGRMFFEVVKTETTLWPLGEQFSDDDMSMGSRQVQFVFQGQ
jgi:hypothetical protein